MSEITLFGSKSELERTLDSMQIVEIMVESEKFCLTRVGEEVFVFEPKCPHFDHSLLNAKVSPHGKITCL